MNAVAIIWKIANQINVMRSMPIVVIGVALGAFDVSAQTTNLDLHELNRIMPSVDITQSQKDRNEFTFVTWREPKLTLQPNGFRLDMYWNSLDDEKWPFTKILDSLLSRTCGSSFYGRTAALASQLYASPSLTPEVALGGNGGSTFRKNAVATLANCSVELTAVGARWHTLSAIVTYNGGTQTQTASGVFHYRWDGTFPANAVTIADVQHALIWTRHYSAMVDGSYGPYTRRAANAWQISKGYNGTGTLTVEQTIELVKEGLQLRDTFGWAYLHDDAVGFSVGVPTKLVDLTPPTLDGTVREYGSNGEVGHWVGVVPGSYACNNMDDMFEKLSVSGGTREVHYKARKDDWFVIAGQSGDKLFYTRAQCRDQGIVTLVANVPKERAHILEFLFVALSNSLSLKPILKPYAQPTPRLRFPSSPPGYASAAVAPSPSLPNTTRSASSVASSVDRTGKTSVIRLALADKSELGAKEVFEKASGSIFIVHTANAQGSAVAISERNLITNCHILGSEGTVVLEQEGRRSVAKLTSANVDADRCILTSEAPVQNWVRVRPYADVKIGERVFTIGTPQGLELTIAEGIISSKRILDGERLLQTSAPISKGSSGGGLFDTYGHLIGVTTWMLKGGQNLNFAIAAEEYAK